MQRFAFFVVAIVLVAGVAYVVTRSSENSGHLRTCLFPKQTTTIHPFDFNKDQLGAVTSPPSNPDVEVPQISETGPWPKAEVPDLNHHFGRMQLHSTGGHHEFVIRNKGEAILELVAGKATCQCTKFTVRKDKLAPGEETIVDIDWKAETKTPAFSHGGPVFTNDPKMPKIDFVVEGIIDAAIDVFPNRCGMWEMCSATNRPS